MRPILKVLIICVLLFSCNNRDSPKNNNQINRKMFNNKKEYTVIADGGNNYAFLFEKNLDLGDSTALLINKNGEIIKNFKSRKEVDNMIISGTFYKNKSLLLSLNTRKLLLYEITTGNTYYSSVNEYKDNFLEQGQFFLVNDSVAIFLTENDYGGANYAGKNLIALNMKTGQKKNLAENIGSMYKNEEGIYFIKELKNVYLISSNVEIKQVSDVGKNVIELNGNTSYSGYLFWTGLSDRLNILLDKKLKDYSDRIYEFSEINQTRYKSSYSFELMDNKLNKVVFKDIFPKDGYDIQTIKIISNTHVLFTMFNRKSPAIKKTLILTIMDKRYHPLPENRWILGNTYDYVLLDGDELGVYNLKNYNINEVVKSENISEIYMNKGCCGFYFYATPNIGFGSDLYMIDVENLTEKKIKHLSPQELN